MIEFRFLKTSDASRLTTGAMVNAANPDLSASNIRPFKPVNEATPAAERLQDLVSIAKFGKSTSEIDIRAKIDACHREHRDLDGRIDTLVAQREADELQIRRLKKRKLHLKDMIVALQMLLVPDIPA